MSEAPAPAVRHRRRGVGAAVRVLACAGVSTALVASVVSGAEPGTGPAAPEAAPAAAPAGPSAAVAEAVGRRLVDRLERAWDGGSYRDFTALAATEALERRSADATWRALTALDVERLDLRWVSPAGPSAGATPGRTAAVVQVVWERAGWSRPATNQIELVHTVNEAAGQPTGDLVGIVARTGEPAPLWAMAPLRVAATPTGAAVVALSARPVPSRLRRLVEAAARQVARMLPDRERQAQLVVVAARSAAEFAGLVADRFDFTEVAAVSTTVDGSVRRQAPVQVLLNPRVFDRLGPVAAGVVLAHEATHVATGATSARLPLWVAEGFADFVALRGAGVPVQVAAGQAIAAARRNGPPGRLPTAADFGTDAHGLGRAYELAWLALRVLRQRAGPEATIDFYRAVAAGDAVGPALRATAGFGVAALIRSWRAELDRLAGVRG